MNLLRNYLGTLLNLIDNNQLNIAVIKNFPFFHYEQEKLNFAHNPFSKIKQYDNNPLKITSYQYDIVVNGYELASGSIRNNDRQSLINNFKLIGYSEKLIKEKFNGILKALSYGAPQHGGAAIGIERLLMLILDEENIRHVTAFPCNTKGLCPFFNYPSSINKQELDILNISKYSQLIIKIS